MACVAVNCRWARMQYFFFCACARVALLFSSIFFLGEVLFAVTDEYADNCGRKIFWLEVQRALGCYYF